MKVSKLTKFASVTLLVLGFFMATSEKSHAQCNGGTGSVSAKGTLYFASVDASRLIHYGAKAGSVSKTAVIKNGLNNACEQYTSYAISGTLNLPYPNGTILYIANKGNYLSPGPIYVTVVNGSINTTVVASGAATGLKSDNFYVYSLANVMVMSVLQPWK